MADIGDIEPMVDEAFDCGLNSLTRWKQAAVQAIQRR